VCVVALLACLVFALPLTTPPLPPPPSNPERAVMMDSIKWGLDWLLKAHHKPDALIYQVASFDDHSYWGAPESFPSSMKRPSFELNPQHPGSDIAGEVAAAFAAASLVFAESDSVYSQTLLLHARQLFDFADTHRGIGSKDFYGSTGYKDELAWSAAWLFKATGEADYLQKAELMFDACCGGHSGTTKTDFDWGDKGPGAQLLLFHLTNSDKYKEGITKYLQTWLKKPKTPKGLTFFSAWGSNRYTANTAFIALMAATYGLNPEGNYVGWAQEEIDYILTAGGKVDAKSGRPEYSYLIGFGYVFGEGREGGRERRGGGAARILIRHHNTYSHPVPPFPPITNTARTSPTRLTIDPPPATGLSATAPPSPTLIFCMGHWWEGRERRTTMSMIARIIRRMYVFEEGEGGREGWRVWNVS